MPNPYLTEAIHCAGPGCDRVRGEVNRWFVTGLTEDAQTGEESFYCRPFNASFPIGEEEQPVCGQQCAQKIFEQWLQKA
jgi:hypothetical protein